MRTYLKLRQATDGQVEGMVDHLVRWISARLLWRITFGALLLWLGAGWSGWGHALFGGAGGLLVGWSLIDWLRLAAERYRLHRLPQGAEIPWPRLPLLAAARRRLGW